MEHILISVRLKISNIKRAVFYSRRNGGTELKNSKRLKKFISGVLALTMLSLCICQTAVFADAVPRQPRIEARLHTASPPVASSVSVCAIS